jgi:hypothetical protein
MAFWQSLVIALIPTIAVAVGFWQATRDLSLKRRLDGTDRFLEVASVANGRPRDGREHVGTAEQCAAIFMLAEFGLSERHLRRPARSALEEVVSWDVTVASVKVAAQSALAELTR